LISAEPSPHRLRRDPANIDAALTYYALTHYALTHYALTHYAPTYYALIYHVPIYRAWPRSSHTTFLLN
jgi:hypothetical protein